ncbi:hypothetical protein RYX36_028029 [Vicia faba]
MDIQTVAKLDPLKILQSGHKIQVVSWPREFNHWMEVLTEQETYMLYNGEPLKNDIPLKACDNEIKLLFNSATTLCKTPLDNIPLHKFNFKPISDFSWWKLQA